MPLLVYDNGVIRKAKIRDYVEAIKALLQLIPMGRVTTYGDLAGIIGVSPRFIGKLVSLNDEVIVVPCHRVVRSNGSLGGYSAFSGPEFKRKILELEGVEFKNGGKVCKKSIISIRELVFR